MAQFGRGVLDIAQGKNSAFVAAMNQKMLWNGRAANKRTNSRIDQLQENQELLARQASQGSQGSQQSQSTKQNKSNSFQPINIENLTITTVQTGNDRKSVEKADKVNTKNIQLFEELNKSVKQIAINTKEKIKQDTKIAKKLSTGGSGNGTGIKKIAGMDISKIKAKGSSFLDFMSGLFNKFATLLGGIAAIKLLAGLAKSLVSLPISVITTGFNLLKGIGKLGIGTVKKLTKGLINFAKMPKHVWDGFKTLSKMPKKAWKNFTQVFRNYQAGGIHTIRKSKAFANAVREAVEIEMARAGLLSRRFVKGAKGIKDLAFKYGAMAQAYPSLLGQRVRKNFGKFLESMKHPKFGKWIGSIKSTLGGAAAGLAGGLAKGAKNAIEFGKAGVARGALAMLGWMVSPAGLVVAGAAIVGLITYGVMKLLGYDTDKMAKDALSWFGEKWTGIKEWWDSWDASSVTEAWQNSFIGKRISEWWNSWDVETLWTDLQYFWEDLKKDPLGTLYDVAKGTAKSVFDTFYEITDNATAWVWNQIYPKLNTYIGPMIKGWNSLADSWIGNNLGFGKFTMGKNGEYFQASKIGDRNENRRKNRQFQRNLTLTIRSEENFIEKFLRMIRNGDKSSETQSLLQQHMEAYKYLTGKEYIPRINSIMDTKVGKGVYSIAEATGSFIAKKASKLKNIDGSDTFGNLSFLGIEYTSSGVTNKTGLSNSNLKKLKKALGIRESGNNYKKVNSLGYVGKYQFGAAALTDLGVVYPGTKNRDLTEAKNWKIPGGINKFKNTPALQEELMDRNLNLNAKRLGSNKGETQEEIAGMLAAAHLLGAGGAKSRTGSDANGTTFQDYYQLGVNAVNGIMPKSSSSSSISSVYNTVYNTVSNIGTKLTGTLGASQGLNGSYINTIAGKTGAMAANARGFIGKGLTYSQSNRGVNSVGALMDGATSMDCSSFVGMIVYTTYGIPKNVFGGNTVTQYAYLSKPGNATVINRGQEQPGDIVTYMRDYAISGHNHVAIVSGKNTQIHMSSGANGVVESPINWNGDRAVKIFRINPLGNQAKVITNMPEIGTVAPGSSFIPGIGVIPNKGNILNTVNNTIENLQKEIYTIREGILTKEERQRKKEGKDGLYGILPVPACAH